MPLGTSRRTVFVPPTTSVCPAFAPPWKRTTTSAQEVKRSTIFPLPSSPHWAPTITTFDMRRTLSRTAGSGSKEDLANIEHVGKPTQPVEDLGARSPIHVDQGQRLSVRSIAGERELGDVDLRLAERVTDVADDARLILVRHHQHGSRGSRLHLEAIDPDDARLALAEDGPSHLVRLGARAEAQGHEAREVRRVVRLHLGDGEAPLACKRRRGYLVDRLGEEVSQKPLQHRSREAADRFRRGLAGVDDLHRLGRAFQGKLAGERPDLLAETQEGSQTLKDFARYARHVHRVPHGA